MTTRKPSIFARNDLSNSQEPEVVESWSLDYCGTSRYSLGDSTGSMYSAEKREREIVEGDMATTFPGVVQHLALLETFRK